MKYRVFDVDNKAEYTKEMGFDELKDFFEPDIEIFGEEMHDKSAPLVKTFLFYHSLTQ